MATGVPGHPHSRLFYVSDAHTKTTFLVDTGSEVSVISPTPADRRRSPDPLTLIAVNNTAIRTYGKRSLTLNLGLRRSLPWIFVIADVKKPILGADFLRHFGLLVDMRHRKLTDAHTNLFIQGILSSDPSPSPSICAKDVDNPHLKLLSEFPALTQVCTPDAPTKHDIEHHIVTTDLSPPPPSRTRPSQSCQEGIRAHAPTWNHPSLLQPMVIAPPHGAQEDSW